ncbi:hypothetical protein ACFLT4_06185 [Chloroflexota bacterium]
MTESGKEDIILMVVLMLTKDDVLTYADELMIPRERITDDIIETLKEKINQDLGEWREVIKGMVKKAIGCPLGIDCSPSCAFRKVCGCKSPREV